MVQTVICKPPFTWGTIHDRTFYVSIYFYPGGRNNSETKKKKDTENSGVS